uniref:EF-hand calcium-binding domain-containing protein 6-like n=1 Tax=Styela clava TaxID=7725 RepID=UPI00193AA98D|nr:EF-hand calcium-binding domain-containing protein 6-like [Styela clava]
MSQVSVSRLGQPDKGMGMLPRIEHPLSRLGNPDTMSVRGISRSGSRNENEAVQDTSSQRGMVVRRSAQSRNGSAAHKKVFSPVPLDAIPEGVKIQAATDQTKPRLPVFGSNRNFSRAESRASNASRMSTMSRPSTRTRIEIDELEAILKEKLKAGGFFAIRQMFKNNDPEGRGNVTTEALLHIMTSVLGRLISPKQYHMLLKRLHLDERTVIKFDEFYSQFRESVSSEYPRWLDPIARKQVERSQMTASQVHAQLKEHAKQRFLDLADLVPQMNPGGSSSIIQPEFRNVLNKLGFYMDEQEFDKLWKKYDMGNIGVINAQTLLKKLGIEFREERNTPPEKGALDLREKSRSKSTTQKGKSPPSSARSLPRSEVERKTSINIERWLKDKFREGFNRMRSEFRKADPDKVGTVSRDNFRRVLAQMDLYLREDSALNMFLARCGLSERGDINYVQFLTKFQDRSEDGVPHAILSNPEHRFNKDPRAVTPKSTVTAVESKLMTLFQSNFLALLGMFHKIDKHHQDIISQQEFRAAIESRFQIEVSDSEFEMFMENVPLDKDGNVRYPDFMAQFDAKKGAPSLWGGKSVATIATNKEKQKRSLPAVDKQRSVEELHDILRDLVKNDMNKLETEFRKLDEYNSGRLTQEMMYNLLHNMNIQRPMTRGEIRRLWDTYIINKNRTFTFLELIRFYGHSQKSAAFPNAKISPPRRGDNDFMMRSRKLNCDADMLEDNLRAKVDYMWEDLRREFVDMDPFHTGFVSREEFRDLLIELCVHLTNHEAQMLCDRFDTNKDGRVSYIEFLKPFALRRQVWREGNNMLSVLTHPQAELPTSMIPGKPIGGLENVTSKLKQQLAGDWRTLRRAFKKMDMSSDGMLTLPEFRSVLKLCNVVLDEDEVYHVLSQYDKDLGGKVDYKRFMSDTVGMRPDTRKSNV